MTLEEIKQKYKYATRVTCSYQNDLPAIRRTVYEPVLSSIRTLNDYNEIVCDNADGKTAYIGLWHYSKGFAEIIDKHIPKKFIDNSKSASDTFLDKQLLEYKKK